MSADVVTSVEIEGLKLFRRGKVREVYDLGESLLFVATDRISCFDVVLEEGVPDKGRVLTAISRFWFNFFSNVPNHFLSTSVSALPPEVGRYLPVLAGRTMIVQKCEVYPIEWIVRGYLAGSGYKEYKKTGGIGGQFLPEGLVEGSKLPRSIVTPTTKAETGHDQPLTLEQAVRRVPNGLGSRIVELSLEVYERAARYALERGVILADTKFEWGVHAGKLLLVDEVLTPDSSRYWDRSMYEGQRELVSYDKQFVRDYLEHTGWNKAPPPPPLPDDILAGTTEKYRHLHKLLVGSSLDGHLTKRRRR